jgi:citrate synthase
MTGDDGWKTRITLVEPNTLLISGHPLQDLIGKRDLLEVAHLLVTGKLPDEDTLAKLEGLAVGAARLPSPQLGMDPEEDVSKTIARCLLMDMDLAGFQGDEVERTAFTLGRMASYLAGMFGHISAMENLSSRRFSHHVYTAVTGEVEIRQDVSHLLESMMVASVDHGLTPPSAQATIIAATTRCSYEVALASGVSAITDVHGGAGSAAARFFSECVGRSRDEEVPLEDAIRGQVSEYLDAGRRVKGLGHRIHTQDPRRDAIWALAEASGLAKDHVRASRMVSGIFESIKGKKLPINVDGVIGAVVADLGFDPVMAKVLFIYGRIAGPSAHYFEELATQRPMRKVDFSRAVYIGEIK